MGMGSDDCGCSTFAVVAHSNFFAGGFAVEVEEYVGGLE